jgi:hypothetical protein
VKRKDALRETVDVLRGGYLRFVPAIAVTWVLVELAAAQVPKAPDAARAGLLLASLGFYTAAAASCRSGREENPVWLGLERASGAIDLFVIALTLGAVTGVGLGLGIVAGGDSAVVASAAVSGLLGLALLSRLWPILAVPFLYRGRIGWSPAARGSFWSGPGLGTAWRMTGAEGTFRRVSLPVLSVSLVLLGVPAALRLVRGTGFLDSLILYAGVLPFLTTLVLISAEPLVLRKR